MKKIFLLACLLIIFILTFSGIAESSNKSYYMGEAISYNGKVIFGTSNMGYFEIFTLENNKIVRKAILEATEAIRFGNDNFYDAIFNEENGRLYVYLVDGRALYKYDISDLDGPILVKKLKDNAWDWFLDIDKYENKIVTKGTKEIKIWNHDLINIKSYNLKNDISANLTFNQDGKMIYNLEDDVLNILSSGSGREIDSLNLRTNSDHIRKIYNNSVQRSIYVVDDYSLKQYRYDLNNNIKEINSFKHISDLGYDVDGVSGRDHVYFSDGFGVVKSNRDSLKPMDWAYTTGLGEPGGWAMGLRVVQDNEGEKIIVFNNSSILVLDENLELIDSFASHEKNSVSLNELSIKTDKSRAGAGFYVTVSGTGFGINEGLKITLAGREFIGKTDDLGNFKQTIEVPQVLPGRTEIEAEGFNTGRRYSISFEIL